MVRKPSRVEWVDFAKGVAILVVVIHHMAQWLDRIDALPEVVLRADEQLASFRMPMFFLASGLFAAKTLHGSWHTVLHKRVALFAYLFALWYTIAYAASALVPDELEPEVVVGVAAYLHGYLVPSSVLWFIYALALYSILVRAARRLPGWLQVLAAAAVSIVFGGGVVRVDEYVWRSMLTFFVFFLIGVHYRPLVERAAARVTWPRALVIFAAYVAVTFSVGQLLVEKPPGVRFALSLFALAAGVAMSIVVVRLPVARVVTALGRRTLPVYVAHMIVVKLLGAVLVSLGWEATSPLAVGAMVLGGALVAVTVSLALERALVAAGAPWFYALPSRWAWRPPAQGRVQVPFQGLAQEARAVR